MARVKGGNVSKNRRRKVLKELKVTLEVNTDYIKLHKNKFSIVEHMLLETEDKIKEISENYGLQELMLHVVKMKLVIQNS